MYDEDEYDYNRTVEELACIDNLNKLSRINFNMKCNQFFIDKLSKNIEQLKSSPVSNTSKNNKNDQEQINRSVDALSSELDTRTEILTTEINKTKDLVLQLQSTVIRVFQKQMTKSSQEEIENADSNAPENYELPSLQYHHSESNYVNIPFDSNASFEYNALPEASENHHADPKTNSDEEDDDDDDDEDDDGDE